MGNISLNGWRLEKMVQEFKKGLNAIKNWFEHRFDHIIRELKSNKQCISDEKIELIENKFVSSINSLLQEQLKSLISAVDDIKNDIEELQTKVNKVLGYIEEKKKEKEEKGTGAEEPPQTEAVTPPVTDDPADDNFNKGIKYLEEIIEKFDEQDEQKQNLKDCFTSLREENNFTQEKIDERLARQFAQVIADTYKALPYEKEDEFFEKIISYFGGMFEFNMPLNEKLSSDFEKVELSEIKQKLLHKDKASKIENLYKEQKERLDSGLIIYIISPGINWKSKESGYKAVLKGQCVINEG